MKVTLAAVVSVPSLLVLAVSTAGCPSASFLNTEVPELSGMTESSARFALSASRLTPGVICYQHSSDVAAGCVLSQCPSAGETVRRGSAVDMVLSTGAVSASDQTVVLPGGVPLVMVWVPTGSYMMGRYANEQDSFEEESPRHLVSVPGFWLAKYELTKRQWTALMGTTPWSGRDYVLNDVDSPAVYVSWNDAHEFVTALNAHTGQAFRLPTEAEWEFACRAGTMSRYHWGDDPAYTLISGYAWYFNNAWDVGDRYAHVVGMMLPNSLGLHDMSGNVWEWCEDDWHDDYVGAPTDGSAWIETPRLSSRVVRGGSWMRLPYFCRSASRGSYSASGGTYIIGVRIAR